MRRSLLRTLLSSPPAGSVSGPQQTCYTGLTKALPFAHFHFLRENEEQQQGNNNAPQARGLHSSTSPSQRSGFPSPSTLLSKEAACLKGCRSSLPVKTCSAFSSSICSGDVHLPCRQLQQARTMAGPPADSENTVPENTWAKFRTDYGVEKKNDLAAGMYALILTFALSAAVHDLHAYPPRVAAMTGFVFYLLYRRKGNA